MVEVKVGTKLTGFRKGESRNGSWAVAQVKADKGYDTIDVWASNPDDVGNEAMEIAEILSVKKTARKYEKDGTEKWKDVYSVQARVRSCGSMQGFSKIEDEECPF